MIERDLAPHDAPFCTLPADGLAERLAWIRREILPHAVETVRLERGLAFELAAAPGLAARVDHLIALERECCVGIVFRRMESATPGRMRLEVHGVDADAAVFGSLVVRGAGARARAARLGVLASLVVCCVLPLAAAALLGAAAAALAALDGPGPTAAGALAGGGAAWWYLGPR